MDLLFDLNVALDVLLQRQPWVADCTALWEACQQGRLKGYFIATEVTNLFYIARKATGAHLAREAVRACLDSFTILPVEVDLLRKAMQLHGRDLEDNLLIVCAQEANLTAIVTRDPKGFSESLLPIWTPAEALAHLPLNNIPPSQEPSL